MRIFSIIVANVFLFLWVANGAAAQMTVHHMDVAQGDATLIEFQTAAILIDVGGSKRGETRDHLIQYLDRFFERRVDLKRSLYSLIITHPHADHLEWILHILRRYNVNNLVDAGDRRKHGSVAKMKEARSIFAQQAGALPRSKFYNRIDAADIGPDGYVTNLFKDLRRKEPVIDLRFVNASRACKNPNNDSVVVRVGYGETKLLVTGDAEDEEDSQCVPAIPRMLDKFRGNEILDVDIYKAGHHGSHNGTNQAYLQRLSPKITIISAGHETDRNAKDYGHPRLAAVQQILSSTSMQRPLKRAYALAKAKAEPTSINIDRAVYCTCWDGDITIKTDKTGKILSIDTTR
ncbi:MAG: MBL fold metallo-hydrolase [Pyrinomonadaceae bacterium]